MASKTSRRRPARRRSAGGTLLGFMAGLVVGLTIAVVVAIFVTRAPVPFVNKAKRTSERLEAPKSEARIPDPNTPLYSRPANEPSPPVPPVPSAAVVRPDAPPPVAPALPGALDPSITYVLQAGAFRSQDDAEAMRGKLALIGYEARVVQAQVDGQPMFRVRVGPYADLDAVNDVRARLVQSGIEASVIRRQ